MQNIKIGLIVLPENRIFTDGVFKNLNKYWNAPDSIIEFWNTGCKIYFIDDDDYDKKKEIVLESYKECQDKFYREFVY